MAAISPYNPTCTLSPCLFQVVGYGNNNALEQYAACTSLFGAPTVSTFTPTETSYMTSTTVVSTASAGTTLRKRRKKRRGVCKPKSSSSLSSVSSTLSEASSSETPVSTSTSQASSTEESLSPTSSFSSTALFPTATDCPSLEEYSSACACIHAVSSASTITDVASTATSVTTTTVSTEIPSVTETTTTMLVSTVVVTTVVTTSTSTFLTDTTTITTVTSTVVPAPPAASQTAALRVLAPAALAGRRLTTSGNPTALSIQNNDNAAGTALVLPTWTNASGMQLLLASSPNLRLYGQNNSSVRQRLIFVTSGTAAGSGHNAIMCRVDAGQTLTCTRINNGWTRLIQCANEVYIASPTYVNAACTELTLRVDT
ncbi:hypothetical protein V8F33_006319 [Rhypophila sp. PSN 637]